MNPKTQVVFFSALSLIAFSALILIALAGAGIEDGMYVAVWSGDSSTKNIDLGGDAGIEDGVFTVNDSTLCVYRKQVGGDTTYAVYFRFQGIYLLRPISKRKALP